MEFAALAAASAGSHLFQFNRKNFQFDNDLGMEKTFQGMEMKIKQFELYREDVRDLVALTVKKMDNYLVVNTLQLGFSITMFTEGRPEPEEAEKQPPWLILLWTICNLASFMYYLLSMWLAMHASVAAHSFGVRLLTQFVRLPVPNSSELDDARALSKDYENRDAKELFRIPLWKQQMSKMQRQMDTLTTDEMDEFADHFDDGEDANPVAKLEHIQQFRRLQANWQSYDAYARVSMALGTNMTMMAFSYYVLGLLTIQNNAPWAAMSVMVILITTAWVLARLDLYLSRSILAVAGILLALPPLLCLVATFMFKEGKHTELGYKVLVPIIFAMHIFWAVFCLAISKADHMTESVALPTKFRSVLYLDVFGWLRDSDSGNPDDVDLVKGGMRTGQRAKPGRANELSVVEESHAHRSTMQPAPSVEPGQALPPVAARLLVGQCQALQEELEQEISCWEEPQTVRMMREQPELLAAAQERRARLNQIGQYFQGVLSSLEIPTDQHTRGGIKRPPTWLKLLWTDHHTGTARPYFYNRATQGTWMPPSEEARPGDGGQVSDLATLDVVLNLLSEKVSALGGGRQTVASATPVSAVASTPQPGVDTHNFHPGHTVNPAIQRRPLGRMPWHTFMQGSMALIFVWVLATAWALSVSISGKDFLKLSSQEEGGEAHLMLSILNPLLVSEGNWPHAFFRPSSLACGPHSGSAALIAENYAVHQVQLDGGQAPSEHVLQNAVNDCFAEAHAFLGHGLASVSLRCPEGAGDGNSSACTAIFLSGDGHSTLHCNMGLATTERASAMGGKWRALAAGDGDTVWALGTDALVQLRPLPEAGNQLMPQFDIPFHRASNLTDLHVHGPNWIFGLESAGFLHAWPLRGGPEHRHRLPADVKWISICSTEKALFFAGLKREDGKAGVWRLDLPSRYADEAYAGSLQAPTGRWMRWIVAR